MWTQILDMKSFSFIWCKINKILRFLQPHPLSITISKNYMNKKLFSLIVFYYENKDSICSHVKINLIGGNNKKMNKLNV